MVASGATSDVGGQKRPKRGVVRPEGTLVAAPGGRRPCACPLRTTAPGRGVLHFYLTPFSDPLLVTPPRHRRVGGLRARAR